MTQPSPVQFIPAGFVPTDEQRAIQLSRSRVTLVAANAGAAKTTTLALRIGEALTRGLPPEDILALTFTPEAKQVMQTRLVEVGIAYNTARKIRVQTMDEFAARVLGNMEDAKPLAMQSAREQKVHALASLEDVSSNYPSKSEQLEIRTHNLAVSQFLEALLRMKATMAFDSVDEGLDLEYIAEDLGVPLTDYLWSIEYEKHRLGTFGEVPSRGFFDATYDLARALRDDPETIEAFPAYRLVVGDELHDLNEASFRILEALLKMDKLYFVGVGDRDQVIYSQMGADEAYLNQRFSAVFPQCAHYPLTMTYRHGPHLAYAMEAFKRKPVDSKLPMKTEINVVFYGPANAGEAASHEAVESADRASRETAEASGAAAPDDAPSQSQDAVDRPASANAITCATRVVEAIAKWRRDRKPLDGCAILLRDSHQSIEIENALMQADIGYRTLTMNSYLQREEILFLRGMFAIALNNLEKVASPASREAIVESLSMFGEVPMTPAALEEAKTTIARDPGTLKYFFEGQIQRVGAAAASARIAQAVAYVQALEADTPAHVALTEICERIGMEALARRVYVHPYDASVIAKSVAGFIEAARASGKNVRDFADWIGQADAFAGTRKARDLVALDCVAHAKGKEFDHVILPYMAASEFPNPLRAFKEEENLFYVAATRPKTRLTLIAPADPVARSSFIAQMQLGATRGRADTAVRRNTAEPQATQSRRDLRVAYADKDIVKAMGAQWDKTRKVWYVPGNMDVTPFENWLAEPPR
ncbi:ATP-dependent helicase [Alcaligenaceae bacterium C4P045]|nr:ATP-dependent helicase [Alcaligenaceae bacterium C4P045]